ncbi:antibiotic biosynthesis monooxygenase [Rhodobacteraceae bacterium D3-12]|nr:antibiotic biosynthesis monooxygenase [Rhodobacteraceae bacterium D3-12]
MYAVVVVFQIKEGRMAEFVPAVVENARTSLTAEEGCLRFDVCTDESRASEVLLYELYANQTAFDIHLKSAHFKAFDHAVARMVESKDVRTYHEVVS